MAATHDTSQPSAATGPVRDKSSRKFIWLGALVLCLLAAGAFLAGYLPKRRTAEQLNATRDLAAITWQRYKVLTASGAVSRQDGDMQSTAAKTAEANVAAGEKSVHAAEEFVRASKAELQRLVTLQGYERITAPFAG